MVANVETMMYAKEGGVPWHGLGVAVDNLLTSTDAIKVAGIDWLVEKQPVFYRDGDGNYQAIPDRFITVRLSDNAPLGIVSNRYKEFQNADGFKIVDEALARLGITALYQTAGSILGGKQVWALAELPDYFKLGPAGDETKAYLLFRNSHDGSTLIDFYPTKVRVVCHNTVNLSYSTRDEDIALGFSHTGDIEAKSAAVQDMLQKAIEKYGRFDRVMEAAAAVEVNTETVDEFLNQLFPPIEFTLPTKGDALFRFPLPEGIPAELVPVNAQKADDARGKRLEAFRFVWGEEEATFGPTLYSLYNAATGYADHQRPFATRKAGAGKFNSAIHGDGALIKRRAFDIVQTLAGTNIDL